MNEVNVTAPGMPAGATIIESGVNAPAPSSAPAAVEAVHSANTVGMSESQIAAAKEADALRPLLARDIGNPALRQKYQNAVARMHSAAPAAPAASRNGEPVGADDVPGFAAAYEPMDAGGAAQVRAGAVLAGLPVAVADEFMAVAEKAQLPQGQAKDIATRLAQHYAMSEGDVRLSAESEHAEFAHEAARMLGGQEKYQQTVERARTFLESVGLIEFVDSLEIQNSTFVYDPGILLSLAGLAAARGLKAK